MPQDAPLKALLKNRAHHLLGSGRRSPGNLVALARLPVGLPPQVLFSTAKPRLPPGRIPGLLVVCGGDSPCARSAGVGDAATGSKATALQLSRPRGGRAPRREPSVLRTLRFPRYWGRQSRGRLWSSVRMVEPMPRPGRHRPTTGPVAAGFHTGAQSARLRAPQVTGRAPANQGPPPQVTGRAVRR